MGFRVWGLCFGLWGCGWRGFGLWGLGFRDGGGGVWHRGGAVNFKLKGSLLVHGSLLKVGGRGVS